MVKSPSTGVATAPLRVLLAEDNGINRKLAARLVENFGHVVTCVENGVEAVAAASRGCFDVILMDLQMPESVSTPDALLPE